ncbi:hypothetical protein [Mucilaginibacter antarcticus]|uniref:hypothetical protein n=1 Tax=Mucilaginibacter antarcticus TaxID=1855725 RepID=UPI003642B563
MRDVKGFIRKSEAIAGARFAGLQDDHIHFMALPFYETGKVTKNSVSQVDVQMTIDLLKQVKPQQIFAAGDFADPHGTHIVCFNIILAALAELKKTEDWVKDCWLWMYRGAWFEFATHEIEMAVPLSPKRLFVSAWPYLNISRKKTPQSSRAKMPASSGYGQKTATAKPPKVMIN